MKHVKTLVVCLFVVLAGGCVTKGSDDLKSPCACGESKTHQG